MHWPKMQNWGELIRGGKCWLENRRPWELSRRVSDVLQKIVIPSFSMMVFRIKKYCTLKLNGAVFVNWLFFQKPKKLIIANCHKESSKVRSWSLLPKVRTLNICRNIWTITKQHKITDCTKNFKSEVRSNWALADSLASS